MTKEQSTWLAHAACILTMTANSIAAVQSRASLARFDAELLNSDTFLITTMADAILRFLAFTDPDTQEAIQ